MKDFDFGSIIIEDNLVIGIMKEGSHVSRDSNKILLDFCSDYFKGKSFGYISHRINSYSVDPTVYINAAKHHSLAAIAVVYDSELKNSNTLVEKQFFKQPFQAFPTMESAKNWLKQVLY